MARTVTCKNEESLTAPLCSQQYMLITSAPSTNLLFICLDINVVELWSLDVAPQALCPPSVLTLQMHQSIKQLMIPTSTPECLYITLFKVLMITRALQP